MDKKSVLELITTFRNILEAKGVKPLKIILYGSYAKGDYTETSDIDLVIISDDFEGKDYWERIDILTEAIYEVFAPLEVVAMTPDEWEKGTSFVREYARNGEILYAA